MGSGSAVYNGNHRLLLHPTDEQGSLLPGTRSESLDFNWNHQFPPRYYHSNPKGNYEEQKGFILNSLLLGFHKDTC